MLCCGDSGYDEVGTQYYSPDYDRPAVRADKRETQDCKRIPNPLLDPSADKYDYLIVFKKLKQPKSVKVDPKTGLLQDDQGQTKTQHPEAKKSVYWESPDAEPDAFNAETGWFQAVPGEEDEKIAGVDALKDSWKAYMQMDSVRSDDRIDWETFLEIARDHIINQLIMKSGMQLKLVKRDAIEEGAEITRIFCRIRAPLSLLEKKADALNHRLQFKPEVDPGEHFWQVMDKTKREDEAGHFPEIQLEQTLIPKHKGASEILENLYQRGYIAPRDAQVFEDEPTPKHWSRRIRTLERIADKVPCTNRYPAYAQYDARPTIRHLYNEYPSVRGETIFLSKDRLYLTRMLLDEIFDFAYLERTGIIDAVFPLHDANFGETLTTDSFQKTWISGPLLGSADKIGAPMMSHTGMDDGGACPFYLRLWAQPLNDIRAYFGEQIAVYFAWLGHLGYNLIFPSAIGALYEWYIIKSGSDPDSEGIKWYELLYTVVIVLWAAYYQADWVVEEKTCSIKWGTDGFEETESNRPQYRGDYEESGTIINCLLCCPTTGAPTKMSAVTNQKEIYYPPYKRDVKARLNMLAIFFMIFGLIILICLNKTVASYLEFDMGFWWGPYAMDLEASIQIQVLSGWYTAFVEHANEWENYQTETEFEDAKITKTFLFQVFNNYGALMYVAFVQRYIYGCAGDCMADVRSLLIFIFVIRFVMVLSETFGSSIQHCVESIFNVLDKCMKCCCCGASCFESCIGSSNQAADLAQAKSEANQDTMVLKLYLENGNPVLLYRKEGKPQGESVENLSADFVLLPPTNLDSFMQDLKTADADNAAKVTLFCKAKSFGTMDILTTIMDINKKGQEVFDQTATQATGIKILEGGKEVLLTDLERYELEYLELEKYEGTFDDYAAMVLLFGYVVQFSMCLGWVPALALVETLIQIRGDAFKFCNVYRRPPPMPAEDIGRWNDMIYAMTFVGVFTNTAVICFTTNALAHWPVDKRLLLWLTMEHAVLAIKLILGSMLPTEPEWLTDTIARQKVVVDKHKNMSMDDDVEMGDTMMGNLDADNLNLAEDAVHMDTVRRGRVSYLKQQLRLVDQDLEELRIHLAKAKKGEVWNEETQVSESAMVQGLALGMVNLELLYITGDGLQEKLTGGKKKCRVLVSIRDPTVYQGYQAGERPYIGDPGPKAIMSKPGVQVIRKGGNKLIEINQEVQLAPVKTGRAEIVLDVMEESRSLKLGTARIPLIELKDQLKVIKQKTVEPKSGNQEMKGQIVVKAQFLYSKVRPIKEKMYRLFEQKRNLEKDITNITLGRDPIANYDFNE